MKEINIKTKEMHCRSCEMLVEKDLLESGAVTSVKADWKNQMVNLIYDETKIDIDHLNQRIISLGFGIDSDEAVKKKLTK